MNIAAAVPQQLQYSLGAVKLKKTLHVHLLLSRNLLILDIAQMFGIREKSRILSSCVHAVCLR